MRILGVRKASAEDGAHLPDLSGAPRRYRGALARAAQRSLGALNQAGGVGLDQSPLATRARRAEQFWHFLEAELSRQASGQDALRSDPGLSTAAGEVYDWYAGQCGVRPSLAACFAWARRLDQEAESEYARDNPAEPAWKHGLEGPAHFAAVAEDGQDAPSVDGVLRVRRDGLGLLVSGEGRGAEFSARQVLQARSEPDGVRLELAQPAPYVSVLLLPTGSAAALTGALARAGISATEC